MTHTNSRTRHGTQHVTVSLIHSFTHSLIHFIHLPPWFVRQGGYPCGCAVCACAAGACAVYGALSVSMLWCMWTLYARGRNIASESLSGGRQMPHSNPRVDTLPPQEGPACTQHTTCFTSTDLLRGRSVEDPRAPLLSAVAPHLPLAASWIWSCEEQKKFRECPPG